MYQRIEVAWSKKGSCGGYYSLDILLNCFSFNDNTHVMNIK